MAGETLDPRTPIVAQMAATLYATGQFTLSIEGSGFDKAASAAWTLFDSVMTKGRDHELKEKAGR